MPAMDLSSPFGLARGPCGHLMTTKPMPTQASLTDEEPCQPFNFPATPASPPSC
jgi:hypothetical protein